MTTKKDMIRASKIVFDLYKQAYENGDTMGQDDEGFDIIDCRKPIAVENAFVRFFTGDNPNFDENRFRNACKPESKSITLA